MIENKMPSLKRSHKLCTSLSLVEQQYIIQIVNNRSIVSAVKIMDVGNREISSTVNAISRTRKKKASGDQKYEAQL